MFASSVWAREVWVDGLGGGAVESKHVLAFAGASAAWWIPVANSQRIWLCTPSFLLLCACASPDALDAAEASFLAGPAANGLVVVVYNGCPFSGYAKIL